MKRPKSPSIKVALMITDELKTLLEQVMSIGDGETPVSVFGWRTRTGALRKAVARYPNGWQLNLNFNRQGEISSSSARLVISVPGVRSVAAR